MNLKEQHNWQLFGKVLPRSGNSHGVHPNVAKAIDTGVHQQRWLIACSGGADSVACAGWMAYLAHKLGHIVAIAHYNHRWREQDAEKDSQFVRELAQRLDVFFYLGQAVKEPLQQTETGARADRLLFLRKQAQLFSADVIIYGHHLDDVVETLLLRLGRGVSTEGIAAPRPVHEFGGKYPPHWRPFLHLPGDILRQGLGMAGLNWCEDSTNTSIRHPRNAIRKNILPELEKIEPRSYRNGAARTRMLMEADADALDALARERLSGLYRNPPVKKWQIPAGIQLALLRRGLSAWLTQLKIKKWPPAEQLDAALNRLQIPCKRPTLLLQTDNIAIWLKKDWVYCEAIKGKKPTIEKDPVELQIGSSIEWISGQHLKVESRILNKTQRELILQKGVDCRIEAWMDAGAIQKHIDALPLMVRQRKRGDRYRPLGSETARKLARMLMNKGIAIEERSVLPVVVLNTDKILWVPGLAPADEYRILPTTKQALRLTYVTSVST
jgi:tRNA(Ile)-lysidine synthase